MSILYFNNCWFTNVGEAFIDIGGMALLKKIFIDEEIVNISSMNTWYIDAIQKKENSFFSVMEYLNMGEYFLGDYVIYSGMFASEDFIGRDSYNMLISFVDRGVKPIFLGLGQSNYSLKETKKFIELIDRVKPALIVSRDDTTYNNFKDYAPSIRGIDCAFWVKDVYNPRCKLNKKYDVVTYNRSPEPEKYSTQRKNDVIRAYHFQYNFRIKNVKQNLLISDTPYDYLTLYANADCVYTDLVHATIASLQYERHVKFERVDNRGLAIDAVENLQIDEDGLLFVNAQSLEIQKKRIVTEIKNFISNIGNT